MNRNLPTPSEAEQELFVKKLMRSLPGLWSYEDGAIYSAGMGIWLRFNSYGHRGMIHVSYSPHPDISKNYVRVYENHERVDWPSINVSMLKTPEQAAKDIINRFLDKARHIHQLVAIQVANEKAFADNHQKALNELAYVLGTTPQKNTQGGLTGDVNPYVTGQQFVSNGYGKFKVNSGDSVTLTINSMSLPTALAIAKAIRPILNRNK
jgi:hypothetical protein